MWNGNPSYKKLTYIIIFILVISFIFAISNNSYRVAFAENDNSSSEIEKEFEENIDNILGDIDSTELDSFIENDFNISLFDSYSFSEIVNLILSGEYFDEYDSLIDGVVSFIKSNLKSLFTFMFSIFAIIIVFEIFNNFCVDKYGDIKKIVKIIFTIIIALMLLSLSKDILVTIYDTINKLFNFSKILFPILLSLILLSGSNGTYSVYNTLSAFLLQTGSYIFVYILMPIVVSILLLSIVSLVFAKNRFSKLISTLKSLFKYIIIAFFAVFGIFSSINIVSSGLSDGVNYRLTKFAIKSYIPVLGGYLSDGFDFIHTCSVLIKNSFGICGILVIIFMIVKPILLCFILTFMLKILSIIVSFIGNNSFADYFEIISSGLSYFIAVLVGVFMCLFVFIYLLILSVSVV